MGQVLLPQNCLVQTSVLQYSFSLLSGTCPQETLIPSSPCTSNKHQVAGPWQQHAASHSVQVSHQDTSHQLLERKLCLPSSSQKIFGNQLANEGKTLSESWLLQLRLTVQGSLCLQTRGHRRQERNIRTWQSAPASCQSPCGIWDITHDMESSSCPGFLPIPASPLLSEGEPQLGQCLHGICPTLEFDPGPR